MSNKIISYCTKCQVPFEGKIPSCKICNNKTYIRYFEASEKTIVLSEDNREILEAHCKTKFPEDVIAVIPSINCYQIGVQEELDKAKERQVKYDKAKKRKKKPKKKTG